MRLALFLVAALAVSACDSAGTPGDTGATGSQGPAGTTGSTGPAGSANVLSTSVEFSPSTCSLVAGAVNCGFTWGALTPARIDGGIFLMYVRGTGSQTWFAVPTTSWSDTDGNGTPDFATSYSDSYAPGRFDLRITANRSITVGPSGTVRAVLVPTSGVPKNSVLPGMPYAELAARYGLPLD